MNYLYWYMPHTVESAVDSVTDAYPKIAFYRGHLKNILLGGAVHTSVGQFIATSVPIMWKMIGPKRDLRELSRSGWMLLPPGLVAPRSLRLDNYDDLKSEVDRYKFERVGGRS